ncbi:MAG: c-type cytochrome [candidate division Zixibacteria bacterium]|nr:c-type cytochrome [candidate division Zixibacteria bacterium]
MQAKFLDHPPARLDDPYWANADWLAVACSTMSASMLYGDGELNMTGTFAGTGSFHGGHDPQLTLKAAYDHTDVYILAEWSDSDLDLNRRRWLYDGPHDPLKPDGDTSGWTSQSNDDKMALAFEIAAASSEFGDFNSVGCAASCHNVEGVLDMRPQTGKVDIWDWSAGISDPLGYANDQVSDPVDGRKQDGGSAIEHRNRPDGGNNRSGPRYEWDGTAQVVTRSDGSNATLDPAYFLVNKTEFTGDPAAGKTIFQASCMSCHGAEGPGSGPALDKPEFARTSRVDLSNAILSPAHAGAAAFAALNAMRKTNLMAGLRGLSGIPGYFLTAPSGSQADVMTMSNFSLSQVNTTTHAKYKILMIRKLMTGNADDAQFDLAASRAYKFGVALMDGDGRNHVGSRVGTLEFVGP